MTRRLLLTLRISSPLAGREIAGSIAELSRHTLVRDFRDFAQSGSAPCKRLRKRPDCTVKNSWLVFAITTGSEEWLGSANWVEASPADAPAHQRPNRRERRKAAT